MVNFKNRLKSSRTTKVIDPCDLYETLDRASDKGPLRPAQDHVLSTWHKEKRSQRDIIVKLHTGQGKTLIGLLMQQSLLNDDIGPAVYLCPNNFLVNQTVEQARQFGIPTVTTDAELPVKYLDGKAVFVTTVHKLFNGMTRFGLGSESLEVGSVVIDDCHACIDTIKQACSVNIPSSEEAYSEIIDLFESDLKHQGSGRYADIKQGDQGSTLSIPYWAWTTHIDDVTNILSRNKKSIDSLRFAWPLLRDSLQYCQCVLSGVELEITPFDPPLHLFGSFSKAKRRIFMSATVTDDAFLVRGLGLSPDVITSPLVYPNEKWCGEKMVLMPSLLSPELNQKEILDELCQISENCNYGTVGLVPSFSASIEWEKRGAVIAKSTTIDSCVDKLRSGSRDHPVCIANRYDGVDLPDDSCRILIIDSKPRGSTLTERFSEGCRPESKVIGQRVARTVEQGLGRSVRGEKDYCAIVILGPDLVTAVRSDDGRRFFSAQTQRQVKIGLEIANLAGEDIDDGAAPMDVFVGLLKQLLQRDEGWKEFYSEQMNGVPEEKVDNEMLKLYEIEALAAKKSEERKFLEAAALLQEMIDSYDFNNSEKGWYLQEIARYTSYADIPNSWKLQNAAYSLNRYLFKPKDGIKITKLEPLDQIRSVAICNWVKEFLNHDDLFVGVDSILTDLRFGVESDRFEYALQQLGECLGYSSERPDKEWKEGPDNLWCIGPQKFALIECKNQVKTDREEIYKTETGQFNNSTGWFRDNYGEVELLGYLIIPTNKLGKGAAFSETPRIIKKSGLNKITLQVRQFFSGLSKYQIETLDPDEVGETLITQGMDAESLLGNFSVDVKAHKAKRS